MEELCIDDDMFEIFVNLTVHEQTHDMLIQSIGKTASEIKFYAIYVSVRSGAINMPTNSKYTSND